MADHEDDAAPEGGVSRSGVGAHGVAPQRRPGRALRALAHQVGSAIARLTVTCGTLDHADAAAPQAPQRARPAGRRRVRAPVRAADRHRHHRHVRQDHHDVSGRIGSARRRPHGGADRHGRHPHRRRRHPQRADHPGGPRPAGAAGRDGRTAGGHRRHGGLQPRAGVGPGGRNPFRGRRFHQPVAGSPRLSPHHGRLLRGQGLAVRPELPAAGAPRRGVHRRRGRARNGGPRR